MCLGCNQYSGLDPVGILFTGRVIGGRTVFLCGVTATVYQAWLALVMLRRLIFENSPWHRQVFSGSQRDKIEARRLKAAFPGCKLRIKAAVGVKVRIQEYECLVLVCGYPSNLYD